MKGLGLSLLCHLATVWVVWHERRILRRGVPLTDMEREDARRMGVRHPEKIRLLEVRSIPLLNGMWVRGISRFVPAVSPHTIGVSLRYGIYLRERCGRDRHLVAHECVHTGQYERLGSVPAFLSAYVSGCLEQGYPEAPLEREAVIRSAALEDS